MYPLVSTDYQHRNASVNTDRSRNPCSAVIPEPASFKQAQRQRGTSPPRSLNREATAAVLMLRPSSYDKLSVSSEWEGLGGGGGVGSLHRADSSVSRVKKASWQTPNTWREIRDPLKSQLRRVLWNVIWFKKKKRLYPQTSSRSFTVDL